MKQELQVYPIILNHPPIPCICRLLSAAHLEVIALTLWRQLNGLAGLCREPHHKSSDWHAVQHAMALLQAATSASRSPLSTNASFPALLRTASSRFSSSATAISRRPKIGNWTGHERICCVRIEPRWRWRAESISKSGARIPILQSQWQAGQKGQQQLRWLSDGPRNVDPQYQKKYATTPPLSTTIIIITTKTH